MVGDPVQHKVLPEQIVNFVHGFDRNVPSSLLWDIISTIPNTQDSKLGHRPNKTKHDRLILIAAPESTDRIDILRVHEELVKNWIDCSSPVHFLAQ